MAKIKVNTPVIIDKFKVNDFSVAGLSFSGAEVEFDSATSIANISITGALADVEIAGASKAYNSDTKVIDFTLTEVETLKSSINTLTANYQSLLADYQQLAEVDFTSLEVYGIEQHGVGDTAEFVSVAKFTPNLFIDNTIFSFDDRFPYNQIETVTLDNNGTDVDFVYIPKIFIKTSQNEVGEIKRYISNQKLPGFRLHPAFISLRKEYDGIYIQADLNSSETYSRANSICTYDFRNIEGARDWHMYGIYAHSLLLLLALIEFGTTYFGSSNYRGIKGVFGSEYWVRGIEFAYDSSTDKTNLYIYANDGRLPFDVASALDTASLPTDGIGTLQDGSGERYNYQDLFIVKDAGYTFGGSRQDLHGTGNSMTSPGYASPNEYVYANPREGAFSLFVSAKTNKKQSRAMAMKVTE